MEAPTHPVPYRFRRAMNWIPLGLAYAFFYMGRYNLTVSKSALGDQMTKADFGQIFAIGAWAYGLSFLFTGPLTDRLGGRIAMLIGAFGSICANIAMGTVLYGNVHWDWNLPIFSTFCVLYAINMHFQSYGAIAIVTVKAPWFHVRERGTFSTIFGFMISLGIYFAFDWGYALVDATRANFDPEKAGFFANLFSRVFGVGGTGVDENWWVFFAPAIFIGICWVIMAFFLKNTPGDAGYKDFDTGEASVSVDGERLPVLQVFRKIITHPVLLVICGIEFCSGILRNGIMHWYPFFAKEVGFKKEFWITAHWGLSLLAAGMIGAYLTGWCSDKFFQSRRAPMAAILYVLMLISCVLMTFTLGADYWFVGMAAMTCSMAVIGVHGILSGTATADFAGVRNTGAAVGIVDGMVYLGTGIQSVLIGNMVPVGDAAKNPENWSIWPIFLIPFCVIGFLLSAKIWNAVPGKAKS